MDIADPSSLGFTLTVVDHALRPRNLGPMAEHNGHARITGPCGDTMEMWIHVRDGIVTEASFVTDGCGPAHASGSMATCLVKDKPLSAAAKLSQGDVLSALGDLPEEVRHCALLAANTVKAACEDYEHRKSATARAVRDGVDEALESKETATMKIAIPIANGKLTMHFGHCEAFALIVADPKSKSIVTREDVDAPPHQPGLLPPWLAERGVQLVIAGGMGQRAQMLFAEQGIQVLVGAPADTPERLVLAHLDGTLPLAGNACDH
jgi:NifU-like protein involved in Fe-S cluster formation/predicted Fe-Mo cluster-binding NifX family protein